MQTIIALYDDFATARRVIEELVNAGYSRDSISLVANDAKNEYAGYLNDDGDGNVEGDEGAGFGAVVGALIGLRSDTRDEQCEFPSSMHDTHDLSIEN